MSHFLQSDAWKAFQQNLGRTVVVDQGKGWSYMAVLEPGTANTRLYTPYGPTLETNALLPDALASLKKAATSYGATFVRIEPTLSISESVLGSLGLKPVNYQSLNPSRTQIVDLTCSKDELLAQMSQNSRNLTRNYTNKGISVTTSNDPSDIHYLTDLLSKVAHRNHIHAHSKSYFKTQAETLFPLGAACLYLAHYDSQVIAAALVFDDASTRYYAHAAADDTYRKLSAGTALVGQMILDAQENSQKYFDLYGIAPQNTPSHPWQGFTKFKQSFGGAPVDYSGSWDLPLKPLPYYGYRTYQKLRHSLK